MQLRTILKPFPKLEKHDFHENHVYGLGLRKKKHVSENCFGILCNTKRRLYPQSLVIVISKCAYLYYKGRLTL